MAEPSGSSQPNTRNKHREKSTGSCETPDLPSGGQKEASKLPATTLIPGNIIMQQLSAISSCVAKQNTTMLDLPKAIEAQTETLKAMTSMLLEMKKDRNESYEHDESESGHEVDYDPVDEILSAAQNIVGDSNELTGIEDAQDGELPEAVRQILEQTSPATDFGDNLQDAVSSSFSKISSPVSVTLADELKTRYKVPANCKEIGVPKVNPEIWSGLPQFVKTKDARAQHLQQHLSKALIAQAKTAEQILDLMSKTKNAALHGVLKTLMDSAMAIGLGMKELNATRRQDLKSSLLPEYAGLCSAQVPVTEYLFGDNLDSSLKLMKSTSKIVKSHNPQPRYHPYGRYNRSNQNVRGNLNFRRQSSVRTPQMIGNFRPTPWRSSSPMFRPSQTSQSRFRKPGNQRQ